MLFLLVAHRNCRPTRDETVGQVSAIVVSQLRDSKKSRRWGTELLFLIVAQGKPGAESLYTRTLPRRGGSRDPLLMEAIRRCSFLMNTFEDGQ